jgi:hypothetical protein
VDPYAGDNECGAAWKANDTSGALLNVKLDDPTWPQSVSARLAAMGLVIGVMARGGALPACTEFLGGAQTAGANRVAPAASRPTKL